MCVGVCMKSVYNKKVNSYDSSSRAMQCQTNELIRQSLVTISRSPQHPLLPFLLCSSASTEKLSMQGADAHSAVKESACVCLCCCCLCCCTLSYRNPCVCVCGCVRACLHPLRCADPADDRLSSQ